MHTTIFPDTLPETQQETCLSRLSEHGNTFVQLLHGLVITNCGLTITEEAQRESLNSLGELAHGTNIYIKALGCAAKIISGECAVFARSDDGQSIVAKQQ